MGRQKNSKKEREKGTNGQTNKEKLRGRKSATCTSSMYELTDIEESGHAKHASVEGAKDGTDNEEIHDPRDGRRDEVGSE